MALDTGKKDPAKQTTNLGCIQLSNLLIEDVVNEELRMHGPRALPIDRRVYFPEDLLNGPIYPTKEELPR